MYASMAGFVTGLRESRGNRATRMDSEQGAFGHCRFSRGFDQISMEVLLCRFAGTILPNILGSALA
jgi:hypothetical protein